jgi:hypothetical protein
MSVRPFFHPGKSFGIFLDTFQQKTNISLAKAAKQFPLAAVE